MTRKSDGGDGNARKAIFLFNSQNTEKQYATIQNYFKCSREGEKLFSANMLTMKEFFQEFNICLVYMKLIII